MPVQGQFGTSPDDDRAHGHAAQRHAPGRLPWRWLRAHSTLSIGVAIVVLGVGTSLFASSEWRGAAQRHDSQAFRSAAANVSATLGTILERNLDLTRTMAAIVAMNPRISESGFVQWARQLQLGNRAAGGLLTFFVRQVPASGLGDYLRAVSAEPQFRRVTAGRFQIVPSGVRRRYCLVQGFLDTGNTQSSLSPLVDLCAPRFPGLGRSPFPALLRAMTDTGTMRTVREPGVRASIVITGQPVYRSGRQPSTLAQRRAAILGWVGSSFDGRRVIDTALAGRRSLALALYEQSPGSPALLLSHSSNRADGSLSYTHRLQAEGNWLVRVYGGDSDGLLTPSQQGLVVLAAGLLVTILVLGLLVILSRSRERALVLVAKKTDELRYQALHDILTGLPNRSLVIDRADQMLHRARRQRLPAAALFIDLDGLKQINDRFGHRAGDQLLVTVAARLRMVLRDSETVGRIGGDEFVALIEGGMADTTPELVAERVLDVLRQPIELPGRIIVSLTASIGIATGERDSAEQLLSDADVALYEAKRSGRDRYVLFESAMQADAQDRLMLGGDLRGALEREEFFLLYQPTFDLHSERVVGLEALIRWRHPSRGIVSPSLFIALAEESGAIVPIGRWVLREACRQAALWAAAGHRVIMSVNVSVRQLEREELIDDVRAALAASGLPPEFLTLEITETALMHDANTTARLLSQIKELGVRIAIDDFGTGYSSLAYLRQFPVDSLKIDRSFIAGLGSSGSRALTHTLIQLGKSLGLQTLAEGIEEPAQLETLRSEQCDLGQGFLFARPLDPRAVEEFLRTRAKPTHQPV